MTGFYAIGEVATGSTRDDGVTPPIPPIPPDPADPGPSVYAVAVIHDDDIYRIGSFL